MFCLEKKCVYILCKYGISIYKDCVYLSYINILRHIKLPRSFSQHWCHERDTHTVSQRCSLTNQFPCDTTKSRQPKAIDLSSCGQTVFLRSLPSGQRSEHSFVLGQFISEVPSDSQLRVNTSSSQSHSLLTLPQSHEVPIFKHHNTSKHENLNPNKIIVLTSHWLC